MDVLQEEIDQFITFFFLIFNETGGRPFSKELHEAALHHDPEHPGQVEEKSQEDEIKRDPLVVRVVDYSGGVHILVPPRTGSLVLSRDVPGGVHPAVGLQHLLLNPLLS